VFAARARFGRQPRVIGHPKSLWNSYIVGFPSLSKTYATSGICAGTRRVPVVIALMGVDPTQCRARNQNANFFGRIAML
jgi:hypothetical protein